MIRFWINRTLMLLRTWSLIMMKWMKAGQVKCSLSVQGENPRHYSKSRRRIISLRLRCHLKLRKKRIRLEDKLEFLGNPARLARLSKPLLSIKVRRRASLGNLVTTMMMKKWVMLTKTTKWAMLTKTTTMTKKWAMSTKTMENA